MTQLAPQMPAACGRYSPALALPEVDRLVKAISLQGRAPATYRAYRRHLRDFTGFCHQHQLIAMPADPGTVARFLAEFGTTRKPSTLQQACAAIAFAHRQVGAFNPCQDPKVRAVLDGHRRLCGSRRLQMRPLLTEHLRQICERLQQEDGTRARRDRAVLLLGFVGAFRRAELASLNIADLERTPGGFLVHLRRSKTDQEGRGQIKAVPRAPRPVTCPVQALEDWLQELRRAGQVEGPLFRAVKAAGGPSRRQARIMAGPLNAASIARLLKQRCQEIGLDPALFSGHSLRAGHVTQAAMGGASPLEIAMQTGHRSLDTVLDYCRADDLFRQGSATRLGL